MPENVKAKSKGKVWGKLIHIADMRRKKWFEAARASDRQFKNRRLTNLGIRPATRNKHYSITMTMVSSIAPKKLEVRLRAIQPGAEDNARRQSILANWNFRVAGIPEKSELVALNGLVKGIGVTFTSWRYPYTVVDSQGADGVTKGVVGRHSERSGATDEREVVTGEELKKVFPSQLHGQNMAQIFVVDPFDFLIDPQARNLQEARWAAHRFYRTKREIKQMQKAGIYNPKIELKFDDGVTPSTRRNLLDPDTLEEMQPDDNETFPIPDEMNRDEFSVWEVWQVHDFVNKEVVHVLPGTDEALRVRQFNGIMPYQVFRPVSTQDEFWSFPASWQTRVLQDRLNQTTESLVMYANLMGKPVTLVPDTVRKEEAEKIANAQPGQVIRVPEDIIRMMKVPELSKIPEAIRDIEPILARDINETLGASDVSTGILSSPATTATEASLSTGFMSVRTGHIRWKLTKWLEDTARSVVALQQKYFTQADAVPILGLDARNYKAATEEGEFNLPLSGEVNKDNIAGLFDVAVTAGDSADQLKAERQRLWLQLWNIVIFPLMQLGIVDPISAAKQMLDKFDIEPDTLLNIEAGPPAQPQGPPGAVAGEGRGPSGGNPPGFGGALSPDLERRQGGSPNQGAELSAAQRLI